MTKLSKKVAILSFIMISICLQIGFAIKSDVLKPSNDSNLVFSAVAWCSDDEDCPYNYTFENVDGKTVCCHLHGTNTGHKDDGRTAPQLRQ